jgi:hypothetical protein
VPVGLAGVDELHWYRKTVAYWLPDVPGLPVAPSVTLARVTFAEKACPFTVILAVIVQELPDKLEYASVAVLSWLSVTVAPVAVNATVPEMPIKLALIVIVDGNGLPTVSTLKAGALVARRMPELSGLSARALLPNSSTSRSPITVAI